MNLMLKYEASTKEHSPLDDIISIDLIPPLLRPYRSTWQLNLGYQWNLYHRYTSDRMHHLPLLVWIYRPMSLKHALIYITNIKISSYIFFLHVSVNIIISYIFYFIWYILIREYKNTILKLIVYLCVRMRVCMDIYLSPSILPLSSNVLKALITTSSSSAPEKKKNYSDFKA